MNKIQKRKYNKPRISVKKLKINFLFQHPLENFNTYLAMCVPECLVCVPSCFLPGTPVSTPTGLRPIEDFKENQSVYCYNFTLKKVIIGKIREIDRVVKDEYLVINGLIKVTPFHRFWVNKRRWVQARHLKAGDRLFTIDGKSIKIMNLTREKGKTWVYNLHLYGIHKNYFAHKVLVHNEKCL